ncbi:Sec-independent protein translocase protein TatB [Phenylobacterium sp.]|jgi:sec-independent protein translocase protein TatB|uniref:Sec-independent protein translocase protein TatB n=1 Tax=Phenylobacterium sp. TaxID=1871053 RepID=UPI002F948183
MLPEIGATELLVIAIVALIVVGPKDLPVMLRKFGQFMGKLRGMAAEFRSSFDEMARQTELDDLRKEVEAMRRGLNADPLQINQAAQEIESSLADVGVNFGPPLGAQHEAFQAAQAAEAAEAAPAAKKPRARKAAPKKTPAPAKTASAPARKPRAAKTVEGGRRSKGIVEGGA